MVINGHITSASLATNSSTTLIAVYGAVYDYEVKIALDTTTFGSIPLDITVKAMNDVHAKRIAYDILVSLNFDLATYLEKLSTL